MRNTLSISNGDYSDGILVRNIERSRDSIVSNTENWLESMENLKNACFSSFRIDLIQTNTSFTFL